MRVVSASAVLVTVPIIMIILIITKIKIII